MDTRSRPDRGYTCLLLQFIHGILADGGGHFRRGRSLARASLEQVYPRGSRALVVFEVEEQVLVEGEELVAPEIGRAHV